MMRATTIMGRLALGAVALVPILFVFWAAQGIYRYNAGSVAFSVEQATANSIVAERLPKTVDVGGRSVELIDAYMSFIGGGRYVRSRVDLQVRVRDQGQELVFHGKDGGIAMDLEKGTGVASQWAAISYERPVVDGGVTRPLLRLDEMEEGDRRAADVFDAVASRIADVSILTWDPKDAPVVRHIEQIARDYSGKSATVTFYDVRRREVWAWTALLFLGIGLLPFSYAGLSAAWKGFGHRSAISHDLPRAAT